MVFGTIGVCDGIAMNHEGMKYSLASRELIADSIEVTAKAHAFDGLVLVPNCDKIVPGMLMAAARLNLPAIVVSGGPMLAGRHPDTSNDSRIDLATVFEAVGAVHAGRMSAGDAVRHGRCRLSHMRFLRRHVYRQFHELSDGSPWHGPSGKRHDSRGDGCPHQAGEENRHANHGPYQRRSDAGSDYDGRCLHQCPDGGYGAGMFNQYRSASLGDRAGGRGDPGP